LFVPPDAIAFCFPRPKKKTRLPSSDRWMGAGNFFVIVVRVTL
jgi:hypothetical protein